MTRRERFLGEMERVITWTPILALIEPHYSEPGDGTQPMPIERMLRMFLCSSRLQIYARATWSCKGA